MSVITNIADLEERFTFNPDRGVAGSYICNQCGHTTYCQEIFFECCQEWVPVLVRCAIRGCENRWKARFADQHPKDSSLN